MTVVLSSVVLVALGASPAFARPKPVNPPPPTGTITANSNGTVTIDVSGTWSWPIGTAPADVDATAGTAKSECGGNTAVGYGMVWNDADDPGYVLSYKKAGVSHPIYLGSTLAVNGNATDESVGIDSSTPCGTFTAGAADLTGTWTGTHTYASAQSVPTSICVVSYIVHNAPAGHKRQYLVDKNKRNSYRTVVKSGNAASWLTSPACFDPSTLMASPVIVTTATNAQVGSAITDTATLSGTSQDVTPVAVGGQAVSVGNPAGGGITFTLFAPSDTTCSTPIFTSTSIPVTGDGTYGPVSFTPTQGAGAYRWIATYSGDPNNNGATELCGAAGETSTVTTTPVTSSSNPPKTNPSSTPSGSVPVVKTTSASGTAATQTVSGATTVHTGEPWAGSKPFVVVLVVFGLSLMGLGYLKRRRFAVGTGAEDGATD